MQGKLALHCNLNSQSWDGAVIETVAIDFKQSRFSSTEIWVYHISWFFEIYFLCKFHSDNPKATNLLKALNDLFCKHTFYIVAGAQKKFAEALRCC